jgi:predicted DsbA family dithiol-disulfide isomerase
VDSRRGPGLRRRGGLDRGEAAEALRERRYRAQAEADQREAERLGARGAPFLVIDGKYAIPGQGPDPPAANVLAGYT